MKKSTDLNVNSFKSKPIKKILIALDYNPTAQKIAETGYLLANTMNAEVTLVHVIVNPVYYSSLEYSPIMGFNGFINSDIGQLLSTDELKKASLHFLDKTKEHLHDERINTLAVEGDFADAILQAAKDLHVDLIVMGSHSQRWLEKILMGSVTEKVLHHTSIPLFIVPTKKRRSSKK
jgi:nucleotide-binding universal stress UspA family protein